MVLVFKMKSKTCKTCKLEFVPRKKKQIFCSRKCIRNETQFKKGVYMGFGFKKGSKVNLGRHWKVKDTSNMGHPSWNKGKTWSLGVRKKISKNYKPHLLSEETKKKISEYHRGSKNHSWKGGITPLRVKIWHSQEYKLWRKLVFERDNYTCVFCGERGGRLATDHIKSFREYPELRFSVDNGRTLCISCHFKTESYGKWK